MANLTGKIIDVTNQPPGSVVDIHVKAPSVRVGSGTGAVVSSPAGVDYNPSTGELTITNLTGGLSWLVIEGVGWSDTVALAVAEGMVTLVEAIANAAGAPGMADYVRLLASLELAVDGVAQEAVDAAADAIKWVELAGLSSPVTWSTVAPKMYSLSSSQAAALGMPVTQAGTLEVTVTGGRRSLKFTTWRGDNLNLPKATWLSDVATDGTLAPWVKVATDADIAGATYLHGRYDGHADDAPQGAVTVVGASTALDRGYPVASGGTLHTVGIFQSYQAAASGVVILFGRYKGSTWGEWTRLDAGAVEIPDTPALPQSSGEAAITHDLMVADAKRVAGIRQVTTPAIALVLDHGTNNFNEVILPMLRDRGLTCTIALNSQMYDPALYRYQFDNRTNWSMVAGWWEDDGIEIANHGRTHASGTDLNSQLNEAIGGIQELKSALPGVPIHSFVTSSAITEIRDPMDLATTDLGRALWQHHAVIVSSDREMEWRLAGEPKQAVWRHWIDKPTQVPGVQSVIESLQPGLATLVSWHPELMGTGDNHTVGDIEAFLDWVVARRDAGELAVMTLRELAFAQHTT